MDNQLVEMARQRMREGVLPSAPATRIDGFRSAGKHCEMCNGPMAPNSAAICVQWETDGQKHEAPLHPACHTVWATLVTANRAGKTLPH
jgi:hypothetical protein